MRAGFIQKTVAGVALGLAASRLAGCGGAPDEDMADIAGAAAAARSENDNRPAEIKAWDWAQPDLDGSVAPGDDFYGYVNNAWLARAAKEDERPSRSMATDLFDKAQADTQAIIDDARARNAAGKADPDQAKIASFYDAFMDVDAIDAKGLAPLAEDIAAIKAIASHADAAALAARADLALPAPFAVSIEPDPGAGRRYAVHIRQSGLGMQSKLHYRDERFAAWPAAYSDYIERTLALADHKDAAAAARRVYDLERRIADAHWGVGKADNPALAYNPKTPEELAAFAPGVPWAAFLDARGLGEETRLIVREAEAIRALAALFAATDVADWRDYFLFHLLNDASAVLPAPLREARPDFYARVLGGDVSPASREWRARMALDDALGDIIGARYAAKRFPPPAQAAANRVAGNLRAAMQRRLKTSPWMSAPAKEAALAKLASLAFEVGVPTEAATAGDIVPRADDAYGNWKQANARAWRKSLDRMSLDRLGGAGAWPVPAHTVDARYDETRHALVFTAAALQPPFFAPDLDETPGADGDNAALYGAAGAAMAHEMTQAFDARGRRTDATGAFRNWWTDADKEAFRTRAVMLAAQGADYEPLPGLKTNRSLTSAEDVADLGGLAIAYDAYRLSLKGREAPVINGLTGDQRFFIAHARSVRRRVRADILKRETLNDRHAPAALRANGAARNQDAWVAAFGVTAANTLYLPPDERLRIW